MKTLFAFCVMLFVSATPSIAAEQENDWSPVQQEVWATVIARLTAWRDNDYETYLAIHHDKWRRYSMVTSALQNKDDVANFWDGMKQNEKQLGFEAIPVAVDVFQNDSVAVAHFTLIETFEWTGEDFVRPNGSLMESGVVYTIPARFSDFYVKEEGRWLYFGGYRDLTCDILPRSHNPCRN